MICARPKSGQLPAEPELHLVRCSGRTASDSLTLQTPKSKKAIFFFFFLQREMRSFWTRCWRQILYPRRRSQQFSCCHRYRGCRQSLCWLEALSGVHLVECAKWQQIFFFFFNLLNFTFIASRREFMLVTQPTMVFASQEPKYLMYILVLVLSNLRLLTS